MITSFLLAARVVPLVAACAVSGCSDGDSVAVAADVAPWNAFASELVAQAKLPPAVQARNLAIVQIAVHDAINGLQPRYVPYAYAAAATDGSPRAAVAAATRSTLLALMPAPSHATIEARYADALAPLPSGASRDKGVRQGEAAAAAILQRRAGDDVDDALFRPYRPEPPAPGVYRLTPPSNTVVAANWGSMAPFAMESGAQFRSPAPPAVTSAAYADEYREVATLGAQASSQRTATQTEIARFWYDVATVEWHRAARKGLADVGADEWQAARTLAALSVAMADAVTASMETKFTLHYWRPITAIREGDRDGNDITVGVADWTPLCATPPFPEYNSTHAATAAAAATVLARVLGDNHSFSVTSPTLPGATRAFSRFSDAANEEAESRIYCGIHFRSAMTAGLEQGRLVAERVLETILQPVAPDRGSSADIVQWR